MSSSVEVFPPVKGRLIRAADGQIDGLFYGIQPWESTVISSMTFVGSFTNSGNAAGRTLAVGSFYHVRFTSITLTSGTAMIFEGA